MKTKHYIIPDSSRAVRRGDALVSFQQNKVRKSEQRDHEEDILGWALHNEHRGTDGNRGCLVVLKE